MDRTGEQPGQRAARRLRWRSRGRAGAAGGPRHVEQEPLRSGAREVPKPRRRLPGLPDETQPRRDRRSAPGTPSTENSASSPRYVAPCPNLTPSLAVPSHVSSRPPGPAYYRSTADTGRRGPFEGAVTFWRKKHMKSRVMLVIAAALAFLSGSALAA